MLQKKINDLTDSEFNALIAGQEGWTVTQHANFTIWIDKSGKLHGIPPDFLHDGGLCMELPLPDGAVLFFVKDGVEIFGAGMKQKEFISNNAGGERRARCLAYITWKFGETVEVEGANQV